jgi:hypothetical protein
MKAVASLMFFDFVFLMNAKRQNFENDLRSVKPEGVAHVMGVFMDYMVEGNESPKSKVESDSSKIDITLLVEIECNVDIICDEELIESD